MPQRFLKSSHQFKVLSSMHSVDAVPRSLQTPRGILGGQWWSLSRPWGIHLFYVLQEHKDQGDWPSEVRNASVKMLWTRAVTWFKEEYRRLSTSTPKSVFSRAYKEGELWSRDLEKSPYPKARDPTSSWGSWLDVKQGKTETALVQRNSTSRKFGRHPWEGRRG